MSLVLLPKSLNVEPASLFGFGDPLPWDEASFCEYLLLGVFFVGDADLIFVISSLEKF